MQDMHIMHIMQDSLPFRAFLWRILRRRGCLTGLSGSVYQGLDQDETPKAWNAKGVDAFCQHSTGWLLQTENHAKHKAFKSI